jgi:peptidyl-prolyl cis-trans isomerase D
MVLNKIKKGQPFEIMAARYGTDGTAQTGGDLGWFSEGKMIPKFQEAVFAAPKGLINSPLETEYGYHIIKVTETKTTLKYNVVSIQKQITPSTETEKDLFNKASIFAGKASDKAAFEASLKADPTIQKLTANNIQKNSNAVNDITEAREIIRWAFNDAKPDEVSKIFDLKDRFVLALMTRKTVEGKPTLEALKDIITPEVIKKIILSSDETNSSTKGAKLIKETLKEEASAHERIAPRIVACISEQ